MNKFACVYVSYQHNFITYMYAIIMNRFVQLVESRHGEVQGVHADMQKMMGQIQLENTLATKLKKQLEHERIVLEGRKTVCLHEVVILY